jgi:hypothetical protein
MEAEGREGRQDELSAPESLRENEYQVVTKLFRFSSSGVTQLSAHLSDATKTHISHFVALFAVIWANVIQARLPLMGKTKSTLAVVVDLRKHLPAPFSDDDYLGNLVISVSLTWTLHNEEVGQSSKVVPLQDTTELHIKKSLPPVTSVPRPILSNDRGAERLG